MVDIKIDRGEVSRWSVDGSFATAVAELTMALGLVYALLPEDEEVKESFRRNVQAQFAEGGPAWRGAEKDPETIAEMRKETTVARLGNTGALEKLVELIKEGKGGLQ